VIFVDSNVLIDLFGEDQDWYEWSSAAISDASLDNRLCVNPVSVAEVAPRLGALEKFLENVAVIDAEVLELSNEAAFAAGKAFDIYRAKRRAGDDAKGGVLPDFFIGGHARVLGASILTRDPRFYRAYFPEVPLITPSKDEQ
jgi:hypothetical protein